MFVSQKAQYALRALFELAKRHGQGPTKIALVAELQGIPVRFLEVILSQLKRGGFVDSQRGNEGGYYLIRKPNDITVGELLEFVQGPVGPVDCLTGSQETRGICSLHGDCVFLDLWQQVRDAISGVYDNTTFQDLVEKDAAKRGEYVPNFTI